MNSLVLWKSTPAALLSIVSCSAEGRGLAAAARTALFVGSSTTSRRHMTVSGGMMSPYSCCLKLERRRSAVRRRGE